MLFLFKAVKQRTPGGLLLRALMVGNIVSKSLVETVGRQLAKLWVFL